MPLPNNGTPFYDSSLKEREVLAKDFVTRMNQLNSRMQNYKRYPSGEIIDYQDPFFYDNTPVGEDWTPPSFQLNKGRVTVEDDVGDIP